MGTAIRLFEKDGLGQRAAESDAWQGSLFSLRCLGAHVFDGLLMSREPEDTYKTNATTKYIYSFPQPLIVSLHVTNVTMFLVTDLRAIQKYSNQFPKKHFFFLIPISLDFTYSSCIAQGQREDRSRHRFGIRTVALHTSNNFEN